MDTSDTIMYLTICFLNIFFSINFVLRHHVISRVLGPKFTNFAEISPFKKHQNMPKMLSCEGEKQPPEVFFKKGTLKTFVKSKGKHLRQSLVFSSLGL